VSSQEQGEILFVEEEIFRVLLDGPSISAQDTKK
jgi:hypothetical protein